MNRPWRSWSLALFAVALASCVCYLTIPVSEALGAVWFLAMAVLGTGMAVAGARHAAPSHRRIWVAIATGQGLYLAGDALWVLYKNVLHVTPYPSWADAAFLLRYGPCVLGLCWLVRGRRSGRDRAAFLDAAILTAAFALLAGIFLIVPAASAGDASLFSRIIATAYPIGDVMILAVLLRLVTTRAARNLAFLSLATGFGLVLATDVYYTLVVSSGGTLPRWVDVSYRLTYLLIGFAAMHPSSTALTNPTAPQVTRPVVGKLLTLGCATLLAPFLLATLDLSRAGPNPIVIAIGGAVSSLLVLLRLLDLLRSSESQSAQLDLLARTDGLTGVPNRRSWDHQLARACEKAAHGASLTVAMIDLDHFKLYNDAHGHLAGDLVLKETAAAWAHLLNGHGYLARYGGEEFALFILDARAATTEALLQSVQQTVAQGQTCSMGVAEWQPGEGPVQVMARADEALYEAKKSGRNRIVLHDSDGLLHLPVGASNRIGHGLVPFFQPIVDIRTGVTLGHEALSRFLNMTPVEAFAAARRNGATTALETAAIAAALAEHRGSGWLSLNVSLGTLLGPEIDEVLPADLGNVVFEITEYEFLLDTDSATERLRRLRDRGARIAIDDLGVGFSNLHRLLWLEPEIIKLDISLVQALDSKPTHLAMIRALVAYADATHTRLCAEGVETEEERRILSVNGVELGQGYLFGRPLPAMIEAAPDRSLAPTAGHGSPAEPETAGPLGLPEPRQAQGSGPRLQR